MSFTAVSDALQVSDDDLIGTEMRLKSINALAQVVRAQRADVKADYVLGIGGFDLDRVADEVRLLGFRVELPVVIKVKTACFAAMSPSACQDR